MSFEIGDNLSEKISECCGELVTITGFCNACKEHAEGIMQIEVDFIEDTTVIEVGAVSRTTSSEHGHELELDVEDFTDASGGFVNEIVVCRLCGETWPANGLEKAMADYSEAMEGWKTQAFKIINGDIQ